MSTDAILSNVKKCFDLFRVGQKVSISSICLVIWKNKSKPLCKITMNDDQVLVDEVVFIEINQMFSIISKYHSNEIIQIRIPHRPII